MNHPAATRPRLLAQGLPEAVLSVIRGMQAGGPMEAAKRLAMFNEAAYHQGWSVHPIGLGYGIVLFVYNRGEDQRKLYVTSMVNAQWN